MFLANDHPVFVIIKETYLDGYYLHKIECVCENEASAAIKKIEFNKVNKSNSIKYFIQKHEVIKYFD